MSKNTDELEQAERLRKHWSGPMTEEETAYLRDVQGFIEFAVRNGLNSPMVMMALCHDLNEIARDGADLRKALARGFVPQVDGYRKLTTEAFGDSLEDGSQV